MRGAWVRGWLVAGLVVFLVVGAAGSEALKAAKLSWPSWLVAAVLGALPALVGLVKPAVDSYTQAWAKKPARQAELALRRAQLLESVTGTGRDFPRVREVTDRALLRIHPAIPLPPEHHQGLSPELPEYVPRDVDADVRAWLSARRHTGGLMVLVGPAAAGKTRTAYQALLDTVPDWRLFVPATGAEVVEWVASGADLTKTVVWLDDIDRFVGGQGLTVATVRRLLVDRSRPVLLVGTIWPDRLDTLTRPSNHDHGEEQDLGRDAREILDRWASRFDLSPEFSSTEQDRAQQLAERDPRLAEALTVRGDAHIAQTLAAAPELIRRWRNPSNPYGAAVITAAVTARQCGHPEPLPRSVLEPLAQAALTPSDRAAATSDWFDLGASWAREPVRGQAAPLTPHGSEIGVTDGDRVSDVLVQHATTHSDAPAHTVPVTSWELLITHTRPAACSHVGIAAYRDFGHLDVAEQALRKSADAGNTHAMTYLGVLLHETDRAEEAETWYRRAAEADDPLAMGVLGALLRETDRAEEAETWLHRAVEAGNTGAMVLLGILLHETDRAEEAETWARRAAEAGNTRAMVLLGILLHETDRAEEAETWARRAAEAGNTTAMGVLGVLLKNDDRAEEAETWYRRAAETDDPLVMTNLGILLHETDRASEAETWYRRAAEAGNPRAMTNLGVLLKNDDRAEEAETWLRRAAETDDPLAMINLGILLYETDQAEEAETWLRRAAEAGNPRAMTGLGAHLLRETDRAEEAETWLRRAAEAGDTDAMTGLGILLRETDRASEAETWLRRAADADDTNRMNT